MQIEKNKSRGKHSCSIQLQKFIELANLVADENIEELQAIFQQENLNIQEKFRLWRTRGSEMGTAGDLLLLTAEARRLGIELGRKVRKKIKNEKVAKYIFFYFDKDYPEALGTPSLRLNEIIRARQILLQIVEYTANPLNQMFNFGISGHNDIFPFDAYLSVDNEGFFRPQFSEFMSIFQSENIYYENIRVCEVCGKIFWAKREKSKTCSRICTNILINRVYRKTNKERINKNRRMTYQNKKELEKGKKRRK